MAGGTVGAAVAGLGLLCIAMAYFRYFRLLASAGATNRLLVTFLVPLAAILLGAFALDEALAPHHMAGMAFIGAGLIANDGRLPALARRR